MVSICAVIEAQARPLIPDELSTADWIDQFRSMYTVRPCSSR
jgi:hypothetical protein